MDNDIEFHRPFPFHNIPLLLIEKGHYVFGSRPLLEDHPLVYKGVENCMEDFIEQEIQYCRDLQHNRIEDSKIIRLLEGGRANPTFHQHYSTIFQSSFLILWLGLYTAPEVNHFGRFWNDYHPGGMWTHRWTDQQYWPRPLTLFGSGDLTKEIGYQTLIRDNKRDHTLPMVHKPQRKWEILPFTKFYNSINGTTKAQRKELYHQGRLIQRYQAATSRIKVKKHNTITNLMNLPYNNRDFMREERKSMIKAKQFSERKKKMLHLRQSRNYRRIPLE